MEWASEHFPFLKERRREQCMRLARFSLEILEPFYSIGIDRMNILFGKTADSYSSADQLMKDMGKFGIS